MRDLGGPRDHAVDESPQWAKDKYAVQAELVWEFYCNKGNGGGKREKEIQRGRGRRRGGKDQPASSEGVGGAEQCLLKGPLQLCIDYVVA